jgi:hypothetical protein
MAKKRKLCLIAVTTYRGGETNGMNQSIRDTWLRDPLPEGWDYKFFVGDDGKKDFPLPSDCVELPCPDGYEYLTYKTQEQFQWAIARGYEYIFHCFPDTYAAIDRLVACDFQGWDYKGTFGGLVDTYNHRPKVIFDEHGRELSVFASGGCGYFLSRRALQSCFQTHVHSSFQEDCWLGQVLHPFRFLKYHDDRRFWEQRIYERSVTRRYGPESWNNVIAVHLSKKKTSSGGVSGWYEKQWMYDAHEAYLDKTRTVDSKDVDVEFVAQPLNEFENVLIDTVQPFRGEPDVNVWFRRGAEGPLDQKVPR